MRLSVPDVDREQHAPGIIAGSSRRIGSPPVPEARLYVIPGSHPSMTARLMLELKGIPYKRTDLMPVISKGALRVVGFPGVTVPALKIDGEKVQGSREIARALDRIQPDPPLFPADQADRTAVEEAERFGDEDLQPAARRMLWWALRRDRSPLETFSQGAKLGIPIGLAVKTSAPIVATAARLNEATDENVRADLAALPGMLARVDDYIEAGTLGGETLNAGDLQVATSLRLMMTLDDLRPQISARPAGELAFRAVPEYPGRVPPILPEAWLSPLRETAPSAA
jgi:glutathione S-transferase